MLVRRRAIAWLLGGITASSVLLCAMLLPMLVVRSAIRAGSRRRAMRVGLAAI